MKAIKHIETAAHQSVDGRLQDEETGRQDLLRHLLEISRSKGDKVDFGIGEVKLEAYSAL
jgi:hypothetical protein